MTSALFSTLDLWEDHIRSVLLRRYTHLTKDKLPGNLTARLADPLMEIPLHHAARSCSQTPSDLLRNLFTMGVQCVLESLQPEQVTLLNEEEPTTFQIQSPHATGHFLRFCGRLVKSKAPLFPLMRMAMHYASIYQLAIEAGAPGLITNPHGFEKASFAKQAEEFALRVQAVIGILPTKGSQLDLLAEAMGYENGFQQLKPHIPHYRSKTRPHGVLQRGALSSAEDWLERLAPAFEAQNADWLVAFVQLRDELRIDMNEVYASSWSLIYRGLLPILLQPPEGMDSNNYMWLQRALSRYLPQILAHLQPASYEERSNNKRPHRPSCPETAVWDAAVRVATKFGAQHRAQDIVDAYSKGTDGFELSKELERYHSWDFHREDIDTLDEVDDRVEERATAACWFWLQIFGYPLPFPVGTTIREGVIDGVCDYQAAYYLVKDPSTADTDTSRTRRLIAFERAKLPEPVLPLKLSDTAEKSTIRHNAG